MFDYGRFIVPKPLDHHGDAWPARCRYFTALSCLAITLTYGVTANAVAGVLSIGTVTSWGVNPKETTALPSNLKDVKAIATGYEHSLALKTDGTVVAWGNNAFGQGNVPSGLTGVTAIAAGYGHSLALKMMAPS
jgi:hypothetical protein